MLFLCVWFSLVHSQTCTDTKIFKQNHNFIHDVFFHCVSCYLLVSSKILTSTWGSIFRNRNVIPSNGTRSIWCLIQRGCLFVWRFYLRLGWTCLTAALTDCVHWPPGPSRMESDLRRSLWGMPLLNSRNQDATWGKTATREDIKLLHLQ